MLHHLLLVAVVWPWFERFQCTTTKILDTISLSERACADVVLGLLLFLVVSSIRQQPTFCIRITFHHGNILVLFIIKKYQQLTSFSGGSDPASPKILLLQQYCMSTSTTGGWWWCWYRYRYRYKYEYYTCCTLVTKEKAKGKSKRTTPGIPTWSPTVVLTWPDHA